MKRLNILHIVFLAFIVLGSAFGQMIQAGRGLQITIKGVPVEDQQGFNGPYTVLDNGNVSLPYIGQVRAAGLTAGQLAVSIQNRLKAEQIYTHPVIQVVDTAVKADLDQQSVVVGGQVRRPGPIPWNNALTLYNAIQAAGGATEFGSMQRVSILRNGKMRRYDATQAQFMTIPLQPNDTVTVPQKDWIGR